jgi:hypothetical protein
MCNSTHKTEKTKPKKKSEEQLEEETAIHMLNGFNSNMYANYHLP